MRRPLIGVMRADAPTPLAARLGVSPRWRHLGAAGPEKIYGVAAVEMGERPLAVAWGRLVVTGHDHGTISSRNSWAMDLETISYDMVAIRDYPVRITLKDGRFLAGGAALESTNGRLYHFESRGDWADLDESDPAAEGKPFEPVPSGTPG